MCALSRARGPHVIGHLARRRRVLVRLLGGGGLDMSAGNMTLSVAGTALTPAQIPTPAAQVSGETCVVIAPGPRPDGCYELSVSLTTPAGTSAAEPQSLCYANDELRAFDRVLAIDQYRVEVHKPAAEFFAVASALTSLTAKVGPRQLARRPSDYLMPLRVWIADRVSVPGATVIGYVRRPDGVKTPVTPLDDGLNMDGAANDGIYGLGYEAMIPGGPCTAG